MVISLVGQNNVEIKREDGKVSKVHIDRLKIAPFVQQLWLDPNLPGPRVPKETGPRSTQRKTDPWLLDDGQNPPRGPDPTADEPVAEPHPDHDPDEILVAPDPEPEPAAASTGAVPKRVSFAPFATKYQGPTAAQETPTKTSPLKRSQSRFARMGQRFLDKWPTTSKRLTRAEATKTGQKVPDLFPFPSSRNVPEEEEDDSPSDSSHVPHE